MYLIYFDETKINKNDPYFWIGGILVDDKIIGELEEAIMQIQYNFYGTNILSRNTEIHAKEIFQGEGKFRKISLAKRIDLFENITNLIISSKIPSRMVCINVEKHQKRYNYPQPEYNLGLQLALERFCDFLEEKNDIGIVFGDYEKDEVTKSILDFSQFKHSGKTPMAFGRPLGRLKDTIYFTHSHHSRFLQIADTLLYMANRYENGHISHKWHDKKLQKMWEQIKSNNDIKIQTWPKENGVVSLKG